MSNATPTVFETFSSECGQLVATVYQTRAGYLVALAEDGKVTARRTFPLDLRDSALSYASGLIPAESLDISSLDMAFLAEESATLDTATLDTPTPETTPMVGRSTGSETFAPSNPHQCERRPVKGFVRTAHGTFPIRTVVDRKLGTGVVALARNLAARLDILRNANSWHAAAELEREMGEFARSNGLGSSWVDVYNV